MTDYKLERVGFSLILSIALLMSFQPLVTVQGPNDSKRSNILNLHHDLAQLQSNLRIMSNSKYSGNSGASLRPAAGATPEAKPISIPFSLRKASLVHWFVFAALGFGACACLLTVLDHSFFRKPIAIFSLMGGCAGGIAVLHIMLMGSDLRSWSAMLINTALTNSAEDPSGLIMMASSFGLGPGFGLFVLTTCLLLIGFLSFSRAVPRVRSVVRHERRVGLSQPVRLRPVNSQHPEENCAGVEGSKGGLLVESPFDHYYAGMEVYFTRNVGTGGPANPEEHGSVVRVEKRQGGGCRIAICIIPEP